MASGNTFGAIFWSDGMRDAPMLPEQPALGICPQCGGYLWIKSLELVGQFDWYRGSMGQRESVPAEWKAAPQFHYPDGEGYARALQEGCGDTPAHEQYIRIRLWWHLNDAFRTDGANRVDREPRFLGNLERLAALLDDSPKNGLLRAEIARESGRFDEAVQLCDKLAGTSAEKHVVETAAIIRARALASDERVVRL